MKCTIVVRVEEKFTILELAFARGKQESQAIYIPSTLSASADVENQQISFIYTFSARKSSLCLALPGFACFAMCFILKLNGRLMSSPGRMNPTQDYAQR